LFGKKKVKEPKFNNPELNVILELSASDLSES